MSIIWTLLGLSLEDLVITLAWVVYKQQNVTAYSSGGSEIQGYDVSRFHVKG